MISAIPVSVPAPASVEPPAASRPQPCSPPSNERLLEAVDRRDERRADHREIADVGAVGSLAEVDPLDDLRQQAVDVEVALAVAVRAQVPGHAVDVRREVRAVVEVEAAQEVLVRLAAARVLGGHHAGHGLEHVRHAQHGPHEQVGAGDGAFRGGTGRAEQLDAAAEHDDFLELAAVGALLGHGRRAGERGRDEGRQRGHRRARAQGPSSHARLLPQDVKSAGAGRSGPAP